MDVVELITATTVFIHGLWLVSPFFKPSSSVGSLILHGESTIPQALGAIQIAMTMAALYSLIRKPRNQGVIRQGTAFFICTLYMFYGTASMILFGFERVTWVTTFALAFISGVVYLRLKWEVSHDARD